MNRIVYIYGLREKGTEEFRYIGKAVNHRRRLQGHKDYSRKSPTTHCGCWIKSLLNSGKELEMEILDECTEDNWEKVEISYIALFKAVGARLTNHSIGGNIQPKWSTYSEEKERQIRDTHNKNRVPPPNRKGAKMPESALKITLKNLKRNDRKVKQLSIDGEFIKDWNSMSDVKRELGIQAANIWKVIQGRRTHAGGFKWEYLD